MAVGEVTTVRPGLHYVDTGMYDTPGYGAVYVLEAERPAVIDTGIGTNVGRVIDTLDQLGVEPAVILPTHVHLDHAGGAGFLAEEYPDATVMAHERGVRHLADPTRLIAGTKAAVGEQWEYYVEPEPVPDGQIEALTDGDRIDLGDRTLAVRAAPGHAPHQVVFHEPDAGVVFTADAAGIYVQTLRAVQPTTPPPQFDLHQALDDVDTIEQFDPELLCFAHFGTVEPTGVLSSYKRTLVEWIEAVRQQRETAADDAAVIEHFAQTADTDLVDALGERKARAEARLNTRGVLTYLDDTE